MKIRKFSKDSVSATSTSTSTSTSSSSSSSSSSTSPPPPPPPPPPFHSSITTHSIASSTDSSSSSPANSSSSPIRCEGLDLLVKAIHHVVAGSVIGVPYIQKRVIRRSRRALKFNQLIITQLGTQERENDAEIKPNSMSKRHKRMMALPSKYQDSVLQSWRPQSRRRRSIKIGPDGSSQ